jgi:hypothetical protein
MLVRLIPFGLALGLIPGVASAGPIASFAQTTPGSTPFTYVNADGTFSASTAVVFNFLAPNSAGVVGPVPATLTLSGTTTGGIFVTPGGLLVERVDAATFAIVGLEGALDGANLLSGTTTGGIFVTPGGLLVERVDAATFAIVGASGPLAGLDLLSGTLSGAIAGQGSTAVAGGSQIAGEALTLASAFDFDLGSGLQSLGASDVFGRDAVFGLAGLNPGPLTQFGGNLSGTPAGSDWSSSISGSVSAVPSPCSATLTGLGLVAVLAARRYRRRRETGCPPDVRRMSVMSKMSEE